jgi:hypothetical protein
MALPNRHFTHFTHMPRIRLIREIEYPENYGPPRGMYALQHSLREADFPWLVIGGHPRPDEIPWIWNWLDSHIAVQYAEWDWPFIIGPNIFFHDSHNPGRLKHEAKLLDASSCVMQFTESEWYANLIQQHCDRNEAPIILWSYPIDPQPDGPLPIEYEALVYLKDMSLGREALRAQERWKKSNLVVYGKYDRDAMIEISRRSRFCLYLSSDDRGPLAAAEIALAGCPLVGIERGCPWVMKPGLGVEIAHWGQPGFWESCDTAATLNREEVRLHALEHFATSKTIRAIKDALEPLCAGSL